MNDALYEQLVTRKSRPMDLVIRILCIAALVVVLCGGMLFIGSLAVLVTILLGVLIYYFVFPKLDVEYEYTLLNHDLEIDAIYSKSKRKKLMTLDIQQAEIIAPKNSHRLDSVHADKTKDFSAGTGEGTYAIVIPAEQTVRETDYSPKKRRISCSTVSIPEIWKFSIKSFVTLGLKNAGSVGPR